MNRPLIFNWGLVYCNGLVQVQTGSALVCAHCTSAELEPNQLSQWPNRTELEPVSRGSEPNRGNTSADQSGFGHILTTFHSFLYLELVQHFKHLTSLHGQFLVGFNHFLKGM